MPTFFISIYFFLLTPSVACFIILHIQYMKYMKLYKIQNPLIHSLIYHATSQNLQNVRNLE